MNLSRKVLLATTFATTLLAAEPVLAESFEPLKQFEGTWRAVSKKTAPGDEDLHCRASNRLVGGKMHMNLNCTSKSGSPIQISAAVRDSAGKLSGTWTSALGVGGSLTGSRSNNLIVLNINSLGFQTTASIRRSGGRLYITLRPTTVTRGLNVAMTR